MSHQTNFKPERVMDKVRRHIKRREVISKTERVMQEVRREDRYCRFPECRCGRLKLVLEVAHAGADGHRGAGGDPLLIRTTPENLILLCQPRHRKHKFAVDKKTLRAEPLTDDGLRGPVQWWIDLDVIEPMLPPANRLFKWGDHGQKWLLLAVETRPHTFLPFTPEQAAILKLLATMTC